MTIDKLECPSCGGTLTIDKIHMMAHCEYCSQNFGLSGDTPENLNIIVNHNYYGNTPPVAPSPAKNTGVVIAVVCCILLFGLFATLFIRQANEDPSPAYEPTATTPTPAATGKKLPESGAMLTFVQNVFNTDTSISGVIRENILLTFPPLLLV